MTIKVLVVDDSAFFRHRLREIIDEAPDLEVVAQAENGRDAQELARRHQPDVITMDYEMPVMDGVTAVRMIMSERPVPILMLSSLTYEGAKVTLDALEAGAVDFMPKNFAEVSEGSIRLKRTLHERIRTIVREDRGSASRRQAPPVKTVEEPPKAVADPSASVQVTPAMEPVAAPPRAKTADKKFPKRLSLVAIGTSTGGPLALKEVLQHLPANYAHPILLIQHMPANFTKAFAERLDRVCQIKVKEAQDGDVLRPGLALLAPGGLQMMIKGERVKILEGDDRLTYKPSVDIAFGSAAKSFPGSVLGIVLTGMGKDGCEGSRMLKDSGSIIWSQDEASCVIYGMPAAVEEQNLSDRVLTLTDIGPALAEGA